MSRRRRIGVLASVAAVLALSAAPRPPGAAAQAPLVVKLATAQHADSPTGRQLAAIGTHLTRASGGTLKIKAFSDAALGADAELLQRARRGDVQLVAVDLQVLAEAVPDVSVLLAPYVFRNDAQADRRLDGPVRRALADALAQHDLMFAAWGATELRGWFSTGSALLRPEQARDATTPAGGSRAHEAIVAALEIKPQADGRTAAPRALELSAFEAMSAMLDRGMEHFTDSQHALTGHVVLMSKRWFDGLPEDEKALLTRLPAEPTRDARARLRAMRPTLRAELERRGVRVHTPSKADRRAMKGPLRKVAPELAGALSPAASALLRAARGSR